MCGIFGTTHILDDHKIAGLLSLLEHRGPDSSGYERVLDSAGNNPVTFLHTRLAIQDLSSHGHQPMLSSNKRWWITYNGELYNHHWLREQTSACYRGDSDTETLLEYISEYGIERCLADANGIFAFAVFDTEEYQLYLSRDPFGVKPVYYYLDEDQLTFASELKPILSCNQNPVRLHQQALKEFLQYRYVPSPLTLIEKIQRLRPGHFLSINLRNMDGHVKPYLSTRLTRFTDPRARAVDRYHDILSDAVERQLISDVPVGVLLSAGIDSALVAALAREHSSDLTSHTVGFGDSHAECEIAGAQETAQVLGIRHESVIVNPEILIDSLAEIVRAVEEPLGTTSIMPMWYLTKLARETATVVLSGQGNDEPWGGYRRYQIELLLQSLPILKRPAFRNADKLAPLFSTDSLRRGLGCLGYPDDAERFTKAYALFSDDELRTMGIESPIGHESVNYWLDLMSTDNSLSSAEKMMRIDSRMNLSDDLLLYSDKVAMNCALEVRVPMLDPNVVSFVEGLPLAYKSSFRQTKIVHKEMAAKYLPRQIIERPKQGFQVPFGTWSRTIWRDFMEAHLMDRNLKINSVLDNEGISNIWQLHCHEKRDYSRQLFSLLTLSLWMEEYLIH